MRKSSDNRTAVVSLNPPTLPFGVLNRLGDQWPGTML